jgi:hypothetical protein
MAFEKRYLRNLFMATFVILAVFTTSAFAQQTRCAPRENLLDYLAGAFKERHVGSGITQQGALMEIMASEKGSWSIILSTPNGVSCLVAAGDDWQAHSPDTPEGPVALLESEMGSGN